MHYSAQMYSDLRLLVDQIRVRANCEDRMNAARKMPIHTTLHEGCVTPIVHMHLEMDECRYSAISDCCRTS